MEKSARSRPIFNSSASVCASVTGTNDSASKRRFTTWSSALPENGDMSRQTSFVRTITVGASPPRTILMHDADSESASSALRLAVAATLPLEQSIAKCAATSRTIPASSISMERRLLTSASF